MSKPKQEKDQVKQSRHETRSNAMQDRICKAAVRCLDQSGYAETTINGIQEEAGVSRGALTYHFPSKHDLMATTAMRLLDVASLSFDHQVGIISTEDNKVSFKKLVKYSWKSIVNTPEGRAFIEILVACRTDSELNSALEENMREWEQSNSRNIKERFKDLDVDADQIILMWGILRTFLRGLLMHERFLSDPKEINRMVDTFAEMMDAGVRVGA